MKNIAIVVEDEPSAELLREMEIEPPDTLLGLYQGTPLTERRWDYGNTLPDRILIFQGPHERDAGDEDDLVVAIGETLIHEIGHYFGMSEEEIEEIEEHYWAMGTDLTRVRGSGSASTFSSRPGSKSVVADRSAAGREFLEIGPGRGALTRPLARRGQPASPPSKSIATWPPPSSTRRC